LAGRVDEFDDVEDGHGTPPVASADWRRL